MTYLKGRGLLPSVAEPGASQKARSRKPVARYWSWLITLLKVGLSALAFGILAFSVDLSAA
jgi:hypothetical protein